MVYKDKNYQKKYRLKNKNKIKINYKLLQNITIQIITISFLIIIISVILIQMCIQIQETSQVTYEKCCGGVPCSDTYWDEETQSCKYVFEEQQKYYPFANLNLINILIIIFVCFIMTLIIHYLTAGSFVNPNI